MRETYLAGTRLVGAICMLLGRAALSLGCEEGAAQAAPLLSAWHDPERAGRTSNSHRGESSVGLSMDCILVGCSRSTVGLFGAPGQCTRMITKADSDDSCADLQFDAPGFARHQCNKMTTRNENKSNSQSRQRRAKAVHVVRLLMDCVVMH